MGHGPLDGKVTVNADGTVTYAVPHVAAGQFAEARVAFPVKWLTNLSPESAALHQGENRLDTVLKEEKDWSDQANRTRVLSLAFVIGCGVVCVLLLAWALRAYFKYGREYQPRFTDEYWRDVPDPSIHPAAIGRLWRWDRESQDDFTATLMHLAHVGAIRIDAGSYEEPGAFGRMKTVDDYYITRLPAADNVTDPIDRQALDLLFGTLAGGTDSLWFGTIKKYGEDHPQEFVDAMQGWQGALSAATNREDFFEAKGKRYQATSSRLPWWSLCPVSPFGYSCRTSSSDIHDSHRHRVGRDRELHAASQCEGQRADGQEQGAAQLADRLLVS